MFSLVYIDGKGEGGRGWGEREEGLSSEEFLRARFEGLYFRAWEGWGGGRNSLPNMVLPLIRTTKAKFVITRSG